MKITRHSAIPGTHPAPGRLAVLLCLLIAWVGYCGMTARGQNVAQTPSDSPDPDLSLEIDRFLRPYVAGNNFSGAVLVGSGGRVLVAEAHGMADGEQGEPNAPDTPFRIGSISKTFTALAVFKLRDSGRLDLDEAVSNLVPEFGPGENVTIRQLLEHTSGLPRFVFFPDYREMSQRSLTLEEIVAWIGEHPLSGAPGERYAYSNSNYAVLALAVQRASGMSYSDFLDTEILSPLGLTCTGHAGSGGVDGLAKGITPIDRSGLVPSRPFDYSILTGSGSVYTNVFDLYSLIRSVFSEPESDAGDLDILFIRDEWEGLPVWRKGGWDGIGFAAQILHFPESDTTIIVLSNLNISSLTPEVVRGIASRVFNIPHDTAVPAEEAVEIQIDEAVGRYVFGEDFYVPNATLEVVGDEHGLAVLEPDGTSTALLPQADGSFIHRAHWFRVQFVRDDRGTVNGMRYGAFSATRVDANED